MSAFDHLPNGNLLPTDHLDLLPLHRLPSGIDDEYEHPLSPLIMPPSQIDGLESLEANTLLKGGGQFPRRRGTDAGNLLHLDIPRTPSEAELAMSAMQYLPYPLMVLNGLKTLVMANEAMGRLLALEDDASDVASDYETSAVDRLRGQTLSQIGIDMLQDGRPVWVSWESFLDTVSDEMGLHLEGCGTEQSSSYFSKGDVTPTAGKAAPDSSKQPMSKPMVHDAVVEVIITHEAISQDVFGRGKIALPEPKHTFAKMIITIWEFDDERFYTLTFTDTDSSRPSPPNSKWKSRQVNRPLAKYHSLSSNGLGSRSTLSTGSSGQSSNQGGSNNSSAITSPMHEPLSSSPFPPLGPPSRSAISSTPSSLQKIITMKDALLDTTEVPIIAMWKDKSLTIPNSAARRLFQPSADLSNAGDGSDLVSTWHVWDETFTTRLDPSDYPLSVLIKTQTPFTSRKIGILDPETDRKIVYDCLGEAVQDEQTGEFLAGIVTFRDITAMTEQINEIRDKDEQRFQLICDSMPQMIWTTTPDGLHDWFSQRWFVAFSGDSAFSSHFLGTITLG